MVGVITTLTIREPVTDRAGEQFYAASDYLRLVAIFAMTAATFALVFFYVEAFFSGLKQIAGGAVLTNFLLEVLHFVLAAGIAVLVGWLLVIMGAINRRMARDTWLEPALDFFRRYGLKTALLLLALIGLYRISDIVLGVISNVFYQDLGFTKSEIATAVRKPTWWIPRPRQS